MWCGWLLFGVLGGVGFFGLVFCLFFSQKSHTETTPSFPLPFLLVGWHLLQIHLKIISNKRLVFKLEISVSDFTVSFHDIERATSIEC